MNIIEELMAIDYEDRMSEAEEKDYWSGPGKLVFTVLTNRPGVFEIEIEEYTGCVQGLQETIGIDYALAGGLLLDIAQEEYIEGYTYYLYPVTVKWIRGDGWMTDDDVDYYVGDWECHQIHWYEYLKLRLRNAWWFNIGWKLRQWRNS